MIYPGERLQLTYRIGDRTLVAEFWMLAYDGRRHALLLSPSRGEIVLDTHNPNIVSIDPIPYFMIERESADTQEVIF